MKNFLQKQTPHYLNVDLTVVHVWVLDLQKFASAQNAGMNPQKHAQCPVKIHYVLNAGHLFVEEINDKPVILCHL